MFNTTLHVHIQKTEKTLADVKEMFHFKDFINNFTLRVIMRVSSMLRDWKIE